MNDYDDLDRREQPRQPEQEAASSVNAEAGAAPPAAATESISANTVAPAAPTVNWKPAGRRRSRDWAGYVATAVASALIGAAVAVAAVPSIIMPRVQQELRAAGYNVAAPTQGALASSGAAMPLPANANDLPLSQVGAVAQKVGPAVVGVVNQAQSTGFFGNSRMVDEGYGSGVVFDSQGYIVTNYHVIDGAEQIKVVLTDGRTVDAKVVGADPYTDLAVLKVNAGTLPSAVFGDSDKVRVGDLAVAIGDPLGLDFQRTVTAGVVSGLGRNLDASDGPGIYHDLIQTDATINPGNSGGALANAAGEVIGINTIKVPAGMKGAEGMGFAIPANQVRAVVEDLVKNGRVVNRAYLGVGTVGPAEAFQQGIRLRDGALVLQVEQGSPADKAGLTRGDVILKIDNTEIHASKDVAAAMMARKPGDKVTIGIDRNGQSLTLQAVLGQPPANPQP
ncbi:MAG: S1C family serine protease [Bacillota bacterium]